MYTTPVALRQRGLEQGGHIWKRGKTTNCDIFVWFIYMKRAGESRRTHTCSMPCLPKSPRTHRSVYVSRTHWVVCVYVTNSKSPLYSRDALLILIQWLTHMCAQRITHQTDSTVCTTHHSFVYNDSLIRVHNDSPIHVQWLTHTCAQRITHSCTMTHNDWHIRVHNGSPIHIPWLTHTCAQRITHTCTTSHTHVCTMNYSFVYNDAPTRVHNASLIHAQRRTHMCAQQISHTCTMTHSYVCKPESAATPRTATHSTALLGACVHDRGEVWGGGVREHKRVTHTNRQTQRCGHTDA